MVSPWKRFLGLSLLTAVLFATIGAYAEDVKFEKQKITLGSKTISIELAKSESQHQQGLMFRKALPANEGMLFVFPDEEVKSFWMRNTLIDLSIGYFDKDQVLVDVQEMVPLSPMEARPTTYTSAKPAMYALEMNKGWFAKNKIKLGQRFQFASRRQ
jgi:uncharacterized membrane protein (UPF0127 family)